MRRKRENCTCVTFSVCSEYLLLQLLYVKDNLSNPLLGKLIGEGRRKHLEVFLVAPVSVLAKKKKKKREGVGGEERDRERGRENYQLQARVSMASLSRQPDTDERCPMEPGFIQDSLQR